MKISRRLGQHFLVDRRVLAKIIQAAELSPSDVVLEIGPGKGALTEELARRAKMVVAVEKDETLVRFLEERFHKDKNLKILAGDILKIDPSFLGFRQGHFKIVANIPYYLTGKLLREIFERWPQPSLMVLMLQKEVAERLTAKPPKMNLLAVSVQYFSEPKIVARVSRVAFRPPPEVDSAIVKFLPKFLPAAGRRSEFFEVVKTGFRQPRKLLVSNLAKKYRKENILLGFEKLDIPALARPGNLSVEKWQSLAGFLA